MPSRQSPPEQNHKSLTDSQKILLLEQAKNHLADELKAVSERTDSVYAFMFGSSVHGEESFKSQMKRLNDSVGNLLTAFQKSQEETQSIRTDGFTRIEKLEEWREGIEQAERDRRGEWRKYAFLFVSITLSFVLGGWLLPIIVERLFAP